MVILEKHKQQSESVETKTTTTLAFLESLSMPLVQEIVMSADVRCPQCLERIQSFISRLSDTESIVVNMSEKKVIVTCKYSSVVKVSTTKQITAVRSYPLKKLALIKRLFRLSSH